LITSEIGHGLGLPHADENFFNMNLGNCMDYTDRPWTNTAPDTQTFNLLQQMYGTTTPTSTTTSTTPTTSTYPNNQEKEKENEKDEEKDDDGYHSENSSSSGTVLSFESGNSNLQQGEASIPDTIRQRAREAAAHLEQKFADEGSHEDWVELHRDDATAGFQIELGDGYFLQAHFLLAT
jgi:hypothetical protein